MEKEGLAKALQFLSTNSVELTVIVTYIYIGIKKKLLKLAKYKDCETVGE